VEQHDRERILRNWQGERDSAALYDVLAGIERNPQLSSVFGKLAASEREHSTYWEDRLRSEGQAVPLFRLSRRTRMMARLARLFGVGFVLPWITTRELADHERYSNQQDADAALLMNEERGHAAVMRRIAAYGQSVGERDGLNWGGQSLSNNLRAAVLGANDGLASNFCLMMGVAGGGASSATILLTGVAGLVAGACSMALGEWLSVTNTLEMAQSQMDDNVRELHASTAWKRAALALLYEANGLSEEQAQSAAGRVIARDPQEINTLVREERAMASTHSRAHPMSAAAYSFALFALGASVPVIPFIVTAATPAILISIALSLLTLLVFGLLTSFFNGRSALYSGIRQVLIGAAAAVVTYGAGRLVGAAVG
jgi:VIT1/CCC1 family predicted Fe2+/Mn2+ transporter